MAISFRRMLKWLLLPGVLTYLFWSGMSRQPKTAQNNNRYNETEIVELVSDIYKVLVRLGHFEPDEVSWPPPQGHTLDFSKLRWGLTIDPAVTSLMKRLPLGDEYKQLAPELVPVNYGYPSSLYRSRYIDWPTEPTGLYIFYDLIFPARLEAKPTDLLLFGGMQGDSPQLILDTANNSVIWFGGEVDYDSNQPADSQPKPAMGTEHYRNWAPVPAPPYLKRIAENFRSGAWMPDMNGGILVVDGSWKGPWDMELRSLLLDQHKWPSEDFQLDDWKTRGATDIEKIRKKYNYGMSVGSGPVSAV